MDHINGTDTITGGQHAVEGTGRTAALDVSQHDRTCFEARKPLQFAGHRVADPTQPGMPEFVRSQIAHHRGAMLAINVAGKSCAFGDYYDAEITSATVPQSYALSDFFKIEGLLRNQDHIGTTGNAAIQSNPAGIAPHDFHHHHTVMRFGCGVHTVNCVCRNVHSRIKAKSVISAAEVVMNGLGNAHNFGAHLVKLEGYGDGIVASDSDERIQLVLADIVQATLESVLMLGRVGARGTQNGATTRKNTAHA